MERSNDEMPGIYKVLTCGEAVRTYKEAWSNASIAPSALMWWYWQETKPRNEYGEIVWCTCECNDEYISFEYWKQVRGITDDMERAFYG